MSKYTESDRLWAQHVLKSESIPQLRTCFKKSHSDYIWATCYRFNEMEEWKILPLVHKPFNRSTNPPSGYQLFVAETMPELRTQQFLSGKHLTQVSEMWKALTEEEKDQWKIKASQWNTESTGDLSHGSTGDLSHGSTDQ